MCKENLNADWVVGFVDGEGCFVVGFSKTPRRTFGLCVQLGFYIGQNEREILEGIKSFFGVGNVVKSGGGAGYNYAVNDLEGCLAIRDFFLKHPLKTKKKYDFQKWCQVLDLFIKGEHLTKEGILEIARIRDGMNLKRKHKNYMSYSQVEMYIEQFLKKHKKVYVERDSKGRFVKGFKVPHEWLKNWPQYKMEMGEKNES